MTQVPNSEASSVVSRIPFGLMTRAAPSAASKRSGPPAANQSRAADARAGTYDPQTRTFGIVLSTGAEIDRFWGKEQLNVDPAAIDLSRVALGQVPFLDSHNQGTVGAMLGRLLEAHFENGLLVGTVQLGESAAARAAEPDIASGHLKGVSIGYRVAQWTNVSIGEVETWRADKWALMEVSAVTVPADAGAMIRSADEGGEDDGGRLPARRGGVWSAREIRDIQRFADTVSRRARQFVDRAIDDGMSRSAVWDRLAEISSANQPSPGEVSRPNNFANERYAGAYDGRGAESLDNPSFVRRTLEDALYSRLSGKPPQGAAREFASAPLANYDDILAESRGERRSFLSSRMGNWFGGQRGGGHSTSDFPNLLLGAGNRFLQDGYVVYQSPIITLGRERSAADFRAINALRLSEAPALQKVTEGGEVTYGSRGENAESFKLETFARIFSLTRNAIVNDDLGAFTDMLAAFARAAAEVEANQLAGLFSANSGNGANLADGNPLFTTARGNKAASGADIDVTSLANARQALRNTKGMDGKTPLNLTPRKLLVGPAQELKAEQVLSAMLATQFADVNPFSGKLDLLVEPRLTGNAWRLFADPAQAPIISFAYLSGQRGPLLETRDGWTTLGIEYRAVLDFGCGATDWRGAYLNPGS